MYIIKKLFNPFSLIFLFEGGTRFIGFLSYKVQLKEGQFARYDYIGVKMKNASKKEVSRLSGRRLKKKNFDSNNEEEQKQQNYYHNIQITTNKLSDRRASK